MHLSDLYCLSQCLQHATTRRFLIARHPEMHKTTGAPILLLPLRRTLNTRTTSSIHSLSLSVSRHSRLHGNRANCRRATILRWARMASRTQLSKCPFPSALLRFTVVSSTCKSSLIIPLLERDGDPTSFSHLSVSPHVPSESKNTCPRSFRRPSETIRRILKWLPLERHSDLQPLGVGCGRKLTRDLRENVCKSRGAPNTNCAHTYVTRSV